jgi:hypothetical protein
MSIQTEIQRLQSITHEKRRKIAQDDFAAFCARKSMERAHFASALQADHRPDGSENCPEFLAKIHADSSLSEKGPVGRALQLTRPPFEFDWRETVPTDLNPQWYGPDKSSGRLGARLISQAQGDRMALSSVGMSFYAAQTGDYLVSVDFNIPYVYCDAGGIGPSSSSASMMLGISAFENDVKFAVMMDEYLRVDSMNVLPGFPHFWSKEATDGYAWRALPVFMQAGHVYTFYFEAMQNVGTWGPAGALFDAQHVYVTGADVKPR